MGRSHRKYLRVTRTLGAIMKQSNKGKLPECKTCIYHHKGLGKYPCDLSHNNIRKHMIGDKCGKWVKR